MAEKVEFLGHVIPPERVATDPKKTQIVKGRKESDTIRACDRLGAYVPILGATLNTSRLSRNP